MGGRKSGSWRHRPVINGPLIGKLAVEKFEKFSQLADHADISRSYLSRIISGHVARPSLEIQQRLAASLDVPLDMIILSKPTEARLHDSSLDTVAARIEFIVKAMTTLSDCHEVENVKYGISYSRTGRYIFINCEISLTQE